MVGLEVRCGVGGSCTDAGIRRARRPVRRWRPRPAGRPILGRGFGGTARSFRWSAAGRGGCSGAWCARRVAALNALPAVTGPVVGQHPMDRLDTVRGEEGDRSTPETGGGNGLLVSMFLGVSQPGPVVLRRVQVHPARTRSTTRGAVPVAALGGAPASRRRPGCDRASSRPHAPGHRASDARNGVAAAAAAAPVTSRSRSRDTPRRNRIRWIVDAASGTPNSASSATSITGPQLRTAAQPLHQILDLAVGPLRREARSGRPVQQARLTLVPPSGMPLRQGLPGHPRLGGDVTDRPAGSRRAAQPATAFRGQRGITVGHEGLLGRRDCLVASHLTRRPSLNPSTQPRRVTNVPGYNS